MKNDRVISLKVDADYTWIAVCDPASGRRGRYTVYRIWRWGDKRSDVVGSELDLRTARKLAGKGASDEVSRGGSRLDHDCDWRKASVKLAACVVATLRTGGKIGTGSGLVMKKVDGKTIIERWDKDFVEALALVGIEVVDGKKSARGRRAA